MRADSNGIGLVVLSKNATVSLDHFSGSANTGIGLQTLNTATVAVSNSVFLGNKNPGIYVIQDGAATTVTNLNFGTAATGANAGKNTISGNTMAGLCLNFANTAPVSLLGNDFGNNADCTMATPGRTLTAGNDCTRALDLAGPVGGNVPLTLATTDNCKKQNCNGVLNTMGCPK